jgi:hypothetical protein
MQQQAEKLAKKRGQDVGCHAPLNGAVIPLLFLEVE